MDLVHEAFSRLYPQREYRYSASITYNNRFTPFNANVKRVNNSLEFAFSKNWDGVSDEIVIGLIQELLIKILKFEKINTDNIKLYNNFIKNLHMGASRVKSEPILVESYNRLNEQFFNGLLDEPNLVWGSASFRKLASYNYQTDTVTVSTLFMDARQEVLDYLVYHELLHKALKYNENQSRPRHHSSEFKRREKLYPDQEMIEKELGYYAKKPKKKIFGWI